MSMRHRLSPRLPRLPRLLVSPPALLPPSAARPPSLHLQDAREMSRQRSARLPLLRQARNTLSVLLQPLVGLQRSQRVLRKFLSAPLQLVRRQQSPQAQHKYLQPPQSSMVRQLSQQVPSRFLRVQQTLAALPRSPRSVIVSSFLAAPLAARQASRLARDICGLFSLKLRRPGTPNQKIPPVGLGSLLQRQAGANKQKIQRPGRHSPR